MSERNSTKTLRAAAGLVLAAALVVSLGFVVSLGGCKRPTPAPPPPPPTDQMGPWSASVSGAGGFSGGGASTTVHFDGRVERAQWATAGTPPTITVAGTAPPELVQALLAAMRDGELRSLPAGEPANMTVTLRWDRGDETRRWMFGEGAAPPAPVDRAITALRTAADAAR